MFSIIPDPSPLHANSKAPRYHRQTYLQTSPEVPWGEECPRLRTTGPKNGKAKIQHFLTLSVRQEMDEWVRVKYSNHNNNSEYKKQKIFKKKVLVYIRTPSVYFMVAWLQRLLSSKLEISAAHGKMWFSFKYSSDVDLARLLSTLPGGNKRWQRRGRSRLFFHRRIKTSVGRAFSVISSSLPKAGFFLRKSVTDLHCVGVGFHMTNLCVYHSYRAKELRQ